MYSNSEILTFRDSILLFTDYQNNIMKGVGSCEITEIKEVAVAAAKAANLLEVPLIYSSIYSKGNGEFIDELVNIFPEKEVIERSFSNYDAFEDARILTLIKKSGRRKLIISGLQTNKSISSTAIRGVCEGFYVYFLIEGGGDSTREEYFQGINKMVNGGVTLISWKSLASEWMNDWAGSAEEKFIKNNYRSYDRIVSFLSK